MSLILDLSVHKLAPTINHCYGRTRYGRVFLKSDGKTFKSLVRSAVGSRRVTTTCPLSLTIELTNPNWYTKSGRIHLRAGDADGFCKISIDSLAEALGFNDAMIFDLCVKKLVGPKEKTRFVLCELTPFSPSF